VPFPFRDLSRLGSVGAVEPVRVNLAATSAAAAADRAFEELYNAAFPKVYAFIRSQVSNAETAQELVGRIFLKGYQHRLKIPPGSASVQWIFRIAHTTLIDYWRVEKRRESVNLPLEEIAELPTADDDPETAYARKQRTVQLVKSMSCLPQDDRTVLALKFSAQRTNREIAEILALSEGAVSMRLLRALRRLRQQLRELGWP